ncbi:hypothetical protein BN439_0522 [Erwinia amylovora Ea644]|nr:hypothetical protein BN439_0522 [Erwinia amylovora Ea644]CCP05606.1 hypothetical protein BN440_0554 [Erwinia amylovora MR1]
MRSDLMKHADALSSQPGSLLVDNPPVRTGRHDWL